jgi:DNA-binding transcriptional LysR family regulator
VLVDRARGGLTDEGVLVVERARKIQRELDAISADVQPHDGEIAGEAHVGAIATTARWLVPQLLRQLAETYPNVRAVLAEGSTSTLLPRLLDGNLDAAIVHLPVDDPELAVEPLFAEDLILVATTDHPLGQDDELPLSALAGHPLLLAPRGTALRRSIDRAVTNAGLELTALAEIDGVRLLTSLAFEGFGPTIIPATSLPVPLPPGVRRVRLPELPRRVVGWAHRRRPAPTNAVRAVLELLRDSIQAGGSAQPGVQVGAVSPLISRGKDGS